MFISFQLTGFPLYQEKWPGHGLYQKVRAKDRSMFVRIPGWNDHDPRAKIFDDAQADAAAGTPGASAAPAVEKSSPGADVSVSSSKLAAEV